MSLVQGFRDYINVGVVNEHIFNCINSSIDQNRVEAYQGIFEPYDDVKSVRTNLACDIFEKLPDIKGFVKFIFQPDVNEGAVVNYIKKVINSILADKFNKKKDINGLLYDRIKEIIKDYDEYKTKTIKHNKCIIPVFLEEYGSEPPVDINFEDFYNICTISIYRIKNSKMKFDKNILHNMIMNMLRKVNSVIELNVVFGIIKKLALYPKPDFRYKLDELDEKDGDITFKPWDIERTKKIKVSNEIEYEVLDYFKNKLNDNDIFVLKCFFIFQMKQQDIMENMMYGKGLKKSSCYTIIKQAINTAKRIIDKFNLTPEYFSEKFRLFLENNGK